MAAIKWSGDGLLFIAGDLILKPGRNEVNAESWAAHAWEVADLVKSGHLVEVAEEESEAVAEIPKAIEAVVEPEVPAEATTVTETPAV